MGELDSRPQIALREWAVSIDALLGGGQILVMRKGGIAEETRDFQVISNGFYLLPGYEHQKKHLLKPEHAPMLDATLAEWTPGQEHVTLSAYAEVAEDIEVTDQETLDKLRDFHIWTDSFAEERLKWKKRNPLHVLLLRVFRLDKPVDAPLREAYTGCKSWVQLEDELQFPSMTPVLSDEQFAEQCEKIKAALGIGISRIDL